MSQDKVVKLLAGVLPEPEHEGKIPYMYGDTKCNVTVGVGFLVANASTACKLSFVAADGSKIPDNDFRTRVEKDFRRVKDKIDANKKPDGTINLKPDAYKASAAQIQQGYGLIMDDQAITIELSTRLNVIYGDVRTKFDAPLFDKLAEDAQAAVTYMAYILGAGGLIAKFPNMITALKASPPNYGEAAAQCRIRDISDVRNTYIKGLFQRS